MFAGFVLLQRGNPSSKAAAVAALAAITGRIAWAT
jgi:hypothetical protein